MNFPIYHTEARSILSETSGYIREAGFTHSLTPARNCTYGCSYCYVPTMFLYGGLKREDWQRWGQFTTYKENAPSLLAKELRAEQVIYCSPLVDPYQPTEGEQQMMPQVLEVIHRRPPKRFVIQTRGPLILRDLDLLTQIPNLRVSFSITTNREAIRRLYEPHCAPIEERLATVRALNDAGIPAYISLAPLLPCDPQELIALATAASPHTLIADTLHIRETKHSGATTRRVAAAIARKHGHLEWFTPAFQSELLEQLHQQAQAKDRRLVTGPPGFATLAH